MENKELILRVHNFLGTVMRDCPDGEICAEASDIAEKVEDVLRQGKDMPSEEIKVYRKYRIYDAKTGEEKHGKYFVLKIDAKDDVERESVASALKVYAASHSYHGNPEYASEVMHYTFGDANGGVQ